MIDPQPLRRTASFPLQGIPMTEHIWTIGIDIGATKIEVAGVDDSGTVLHSIRRETPANSGARELETGIAGMVHEISGSIGSRPRAAGVGMAGQIDPQNGSVVFSPNLGWHNVPLQEMLASTLGIPVAVTNDVRAAAWGEWQFGAGRGCSDLVCVFVGTGIGGGIVSRGQMLTGCSNTAGEIGHLVIDLNGPVCTCRNHGCLEAMAGGWAIARDAQQAAARDPGAGAGLLRLAQGNISAITAQTVSGAAHSGDALALEIVRKTAEALIAGAVSLVHAFNPCKLILGGGVVEGMPELVSMVDTGIRDRALGSALTNLSVVQSRLHGHAGVVGAAAYAAAHR